MSVSNQYSKKFGSIFKTMKHLGNLAKVPFTVIVGGIEEAFSPPDDIIISDIFFRSAKCKQCGKCCKSIIKKGSGLFFTTNDIRLIQKSKVMSVLENLETTSIRISIPSQCCFFTSTGYIYCNESSDHCDFFENNLCSVHSVKPVNCALPMIEFDRIKNKTYLRKRPRGRGWRLGCNIDFDTPFDFYEFRDWDFYYLKRLLKNAEDLGLARFIWLSEIIAFLDSQMGRLEELHGSRKVSGISTLWKTRNLRKFNF